MANIHQQFSRKPSLSCCFISQCKYSFTSCHRFSTVLTSGGWWLRRSFPPIDAIFGNSSKNFEASLEVFQIIILKIKAGHLDTSALEKDEIHVAPCTLIHLHTCTFTGGLALQKEKQAWCSVRMYMCVAVHAHVFPHTDLQLKSYMYICMYPGLFFGG